MSYKPVNIRDILNSKINGPQEETQPIEFLQKSQVLPNQVGPTMPTQVVPKDPVPSLKVHLDITSTDHRGNNIHIVADITSQEDLQKFNALYEKHMPKKGPLGLW